LGAWRPGWARVQAICDFTNKRIKFGYGDARSTRTAFEAYEECKGVCRDYAHLAIALCRCMNIPARYVNGYLGDIGVPIVDPMDFSAWIEVYIGDRWMTKVDEIVVTGPAAPPVHKIEDLAGCEVFVRQSSSFAENLRALNESFVARGLNPVKFRPADGNLEDEDILEMVNAGLLPLAVVDDYKAILWSSVYRALVPRPDLVVNSGGSIAWAIRKNSPLLKSELAAFVSQHRFGTAFGNAIRRRYSAVGQIARNPYSDANMKRFHELVDIFKNQGKAYRLDWRMLIAQGYQESQLDQSLKAPGGAVGVRYCRALPPRNP
jgi:hypothetical protein